MLSLFDFSRSGFITRDDWRRGAKTLNLGAMGEDEQLWTVLLQQYDPNKTGVIEMTQLEDLVAIDPRMQMLLNAMVTTISGLSQTVDKQERQKQRDAERQKQRVLLNVRRRALEPVV